MLMLTAAPAGPAARSSRRLMAGLSLVMLMPSLDTSIANAALPVLGRAFAASFQQVQWIVLAYLLAVTTMIVGAGRLGDIIGRRALLLAAIALFTAASLACGAAGSFAILIAARAAQGIGAAAMMALSIALVGDTVPKEQTGRAMGWLGSMSAIGTALGPSIGGVLTAALGWPSIFLVNIPVGVVAFELVRRHARADRVVAGSAAQRFDIAGTVLLSVSLGAYAMAMTVGEGRFGVDNGALLMAAATAAAAFVVFEARTASPLVSLHALRDRSVAAGLIASALVSTVMMTTLVVGPFYLTTVLGLPALIAGFVLSVGPLVAALTSVPAGRLVDRVGARRMTIIGLSGIATGAAAIAMAPPALGLAGYVGPIAMMTSSYASFQAANNTAVMSAIDAGRRGVVAGLLSLSRNLGLITGAAVMGAVFAASVGEQSLMSAPPLAVSAGMRFTFGVAAVVIVGALAVVTSRPTVRPTTLP
jgi:EmrB/QacA subfamily drug resistance transporter